MITPKDQGARCWRMPVAVRIIAPAGYAALFGALFYDSRDEEGSILWPLPIVVAVAWFTWACVLWPRVCCTDEYLRIRNAGRTRTVPREMVHRASPYYLGIWIVLKNGHAHRAWAVQRPRYADWIRRPCRADRVADEINRWAGSP